MFTKYNNINVPKNYSGSIFKQAPQDMGMKTHRAQDTAHTITNVKTSVSPSFNEIVEHTYQGNEETEALSYKEPFKSDESTEDFNEITDTPPAESEKSNSDADCNISTYKGLSHLLESIKNDDLLLLALILLLAKDNTEESFDTLIILALLLMYHH